MCRECFPGPAPQPASLLPHVHGFPALRVLPASPTSTVASVFLRLVHSVDILGPFSPVQDGGGSPRFHDASVSVRAVLLDPAGVSGDHRPLRSPTFAFQIFDPVGLRMCHEAQSLHLHYGLDIALSTLNSCRHLHELKTRFPVGRLIPLSGTGISPAESARLSLAHRKISRDRDRSPSRNPSQCTAALELPLDARIVRVGSRSCGRRTSSPTAAAAPASPLAG